MFISFYCPAFEFFIKEAMKLSLHNHELWKKFRQHDTEMKLTKTGRRMCPVISVSFENLHPLHLYVVMVDFVSVDNYKYNFDERSKTWVASREKIRKEYIRMYTHPGTPTSGASLMTNALTFTTLKLTNNVKLSLKDTNVVLLNTMCRYIPRIHVVESLNGINFDWKSQRKVSFPEAEFIAVSYYRNRQIAQLKINTNPFATAFRSQGLHGKAKRLRVDCKTAEGNANPSDGTGLSSTGTNLKEPSANDSELKAKEGVCVSKGFQESASMENSRAGLQLKGSWFFSSSPTEQEEFRIQRSPVFAVTPGSENGTNTPEPQYSDQTTSMNQSTQSDVLHDGEYLLYCDEELPEDEMFECNEIQGNRSLFGKMSKMSITTQGTRSAEGFGSEYVVMKQCKRRKRYVPRRVCRATSSYSFGLNFKYKSSEGRLNTTGRTLLHLTPSKPCDDIGKQGVDTQRPLSERTPVSPSGGTPISCSGGTPVSPSVEKPASCSGRTPISCSGGTPVSPSVETPASCSGRSPISCSGGTPVSPSVETPASCSGGTPISCSEGTPVSPSVEIPASCSGGTPVSCSGGTPISPSVELTPVSSSWGTSVSCSTGIPVSSLVETPDGTAVSCSGGSPIVGINSTPVVSSSAVQPESSELRGSPPSCQESAILIGAQSGAGQTFFSSQNYTIPLPKEFGGSMVACPSYSKVSGENQFSRPVLQSSKQSDVVTHAGFIPILPKTAGMDHQTPGPYECYDSISSVGIPSATYVANPISISRELISSSIDNSAIPWETRYKPSTNFVPDSWGSGRRLVWINPQNVLKNVPTSDASSSFFPTIGQTFSYNSLFSGYSSARRDPQTALENYPMNTSDGMSNLVPRAFLHQGQESPGNEVDGRLNPVILNSFTIGDSHRFYQVGDGYGAFGESIEKKTQGIHSSENSLASSVSRDDQDCFAGHTNLVQSVTHCGLVDLNSTILAHPITLETFYSFTTKSSQEKPHHEKSRMRHYKPTRTIFSRWSLEPVSSVMSPPDSYSQQ